MVNPDDDLFGPYLELTPPYGRPIALPPECYECGVELCPDLDQYYGKELGFSSMCSKCRRKHGE